MDADGWALVAAAGLAEGSMHPGQGIRNPVRQRTSTSPWQLKVKVGPWTVLPELEKKISFCPLCSIVLTPQTAVIRTHRPEPFSFALCLTSGIPFSSYPRHILCPTSSFTRQVTSIPRAAENLHASSAQEGANTATEPEIKAFHSELLLKIIPNTMHV